MDLKSIAVIKKEGDKWCVFSENSKRNLGCSSSKEGAVQRLRQVEYFKRSKGSVIDEIPIGESLDDGVLYEFEDESLYCVVGNNIYRVDDDTLEFDSLSEESHNKIPDLYWATANTYTTPPYSEGSIQEDHAHAHMVVVDENGNGFTTFDHDITKDSEDRIPHRHHVRDWEVLENEGHIHKIRGMDYEGDAQSNACNSFEVFDFSDGSKNGTFVIFDNMVAVSEHLGDEVNSIVEELVEAKRDKKKAKRSTRKVKNSAY